MSVLKDWKYHTDEFVLFDSVGNGDVDDFGVFHVPKAVFCIPERGDMRLKLVHEMIEVGVRIMNMDEFTVLCERLREKRRSTS
ncbi:MAG: hypothetical protein AAFU54_14845 [Chloroflexota bacterium]